MLIEPSNIIQLENINKRYGADETEVIALHDVSLTIKAGAYCGIMGPSGSGKSTAMNIIGCLDQPSSGEYYLDGQAVAQLDDDELAYIRNLKLGFVFQQFHLLAQLDALENVMLPMTYAGVSSSEREFANQRSEARYDVENAFLSLQSQREQVTESRVGVDSAQEGLRLARLRLQAGVGTQTDVVQSQRDLTTAQSNLSQAVIGYNRALVQLQRFVTKL